MQVSRGIEVSVKEVLRKSSLTAEVSRRYRGTTQQKPRIEARSIHQVSRSYRGCRPILDRSTHATHKEPAIIKRSHICQVTSALFQSWSFLSPNPPDLGEKSTSHATLTLGTIESALIYKNLLKHLLISLNTFNWKNEDISPLNLYTTEHRLYEL